MATVSIATKLEGFLQKFDNYSTGNSDTIWISISDIGHVQKSRLVVGALLMMALLFGAGSYLWQSKTKPLPLINPSGLWELTTSRVRKEWLAGAKGIIQSGLDKFPGRPFNMMSADVGLTTVLPAEMANEIRNNPDLSFVGFMAHLFFSELPGFEPTREGMFDNDIGIVVIQKYLTNLARMTEPLSQEAESALQEIYTGNEEWHRVDLKEVNLRLVARLSSRIFLGEELCRNEEWLRITVNYTVDLMKAAEKLRLVPKQLRSVVHWFMPEAQKLRAEVKQAAEIIRPVIAKRRREKALLQASGKDNVQYYDAIEWFEQAAAAKGRPYDPEIVQLFLSTVAIHTTSDLLTVTLLDIARNPEIIPALRDEVERVLSQGGWRKTSLNDMKLLDSVIKESLRMKPIGIVSMRRLATAPVTLADGTHLKRGTKLAVSSNKMWDPEIYAEPTKWIGDRFLKLRDVPGKDKEALLVSTSERHLGFGHGKHGCPGRFFAGSELKVALAHILCKYDIEMSEGYEVKHRLTGASFYADPNAKLMIRRRQGSAVVDSYV